MIDLVFLSLGLMVIAALLIYFLFFRRPVSFRARFRGSRLSLVIVGPSRLSPIEQRPRRGLAPFLILLIITVLVLLGLNFTRLISFVPSLIPFLGMVLNLQTLAISALALIMVAYLAWRYLQRAPRVDWDGETVILNEDVEGRNVPENITLINASPSEDVSEILKAFNLRVLEPRNPFERTFLLYLSTHPEWWPLSFELNRYLREAGFKTICLFFVGLKGPQPGFLAYLQDLLSTGSPVIAVDVEHTFPLRDRGGEEFARQNMINLVNAISQLLESAGQETPTHMKPQELLYFLESKILVPCIPISRSFIASGRTLEEALEEAVRLRWCDVDPVGVEKIFIGLFNNGMDLQRSSEPQQRVAVSRSVRNRFSATEIRIQEFNVENRIYPFIAFLVCNIEALEKMEMLERLSMSIAISPVLQQVDPMRPYPPRLPPDS